MKFAYLMPLLLSAHGCSLDEAAVRKASLSADMLSLFSVRDLQRDSAQHDGKIIKVRGLVTGASGRLHLMDIGKQGCEIGEPPHLLIDEKLQVQSLMETVKRRAVIIVGRFSDELYPMKHDVVTNRPIGNEYYIGPLIGAIIVSSTDECVDEVKNWSQPAKAS